MLLLFDIDGTLLLRASAAHREALLAALEDVYGLADPATHRINAAGRTDTQIAREIALAGGVEGSAFDAQLALLQARSAEWFAVLCPKSLSATVSPGMAALLGELSLDPMVRLSLLTGNYEPIARLKLERGGIGQFFRGCAA